MIDAGGDVAAGPFEVEAQAAAAEAAGYDGMIVPETKHDPFVSLALAARATERVTLASGIAVAFARNPMTVAMAANDLQLISGGRLLLGLGSQVKAHVERRFSMPWSQPAARMAEFVQAVRAIWHAWETGERLRFEGEFYRHTLMSPFFDPGPNPHGAPPVWIAAVGEGMAETAGRVADGVIGHSFTTRRYLDEVSLPAVRRGAAAADRQASEIGFSVPAFVAMGTDQASLDTAIEATRRQVAFYGSTPAYRGVLELHGWEGIADELHAASVRGRWDAMGRLISDEMLAEFAAIGTPAEVAAQVRERFDGRVTRLSFYAAYPVEQDVWAQLLREARA
ncbi:MAG TPA: TIGR03617 family F420-dependent LLM class oxidoreductase [Alphaproteobacteria bacterium]|nr:TIGR03617 family F420-dependent LLM class oxidoreductase [Alphaproteobacteria bacterium]